MVYTLRQPSKKNLRSNVYKELRRVYQVPAYTGAKVLYLGRPATIIAAAAENYLILRLEDRQDKTEIRAGVRQVEFLEPMNKKKRPRTKLQQKLESQPNKAKNDAFEDGWW
jgi:hypothetical protein